MFTLKQRFDSIIDDVRRFAGSPTRLQESGEVGGEYLRRFGGAHRPTPTKATATPTKPAADPLEQVRASAKRELHSGVHRLPPGIKAYLSELLGTPATKPPSDLDKLMSGQTTRMQESQQPGKREDSLSRFGI
jgi:hypothetical protein